MELQSILRDLYGVSHPRGCTEQEIDAVRQIFGALPAAVENFWRAAGRTGELNHIQDRWIFPEDYQKWTWPAESDGLLLLNENQGVCQAVVRREDLSRPDPPVYIQMYDREDGWSRKLSAPGVSEFLEAALTWEAVFFFEHTPEEFYWLSEADMAAVRMKLSRRPAVLRNWMEMDVSFYSNRPDNLLAVMDLGDEYQALYGGAAEESYAALLEVMKDLGEPL